MLDLILCRFSWDKGIYCPIVVQDDSKENTGLIVTGKLFFNCSVAVWSSLSAKTYFWLIWLIRLIQLISLISPISPVIQTEGL